MTSRYRKPFRYPDGFADVLRDFTREVLREQPRSIPDFGAHYFDRILRVSAEQQVMQNEGQATTDRMTPEQLQEYLANVFIEADVDGSGTLSYKEFKKVITTADLGFNKEDIRRMLMEGDENDDGKRYYKEGRPNGIEIIMERYARKEERDAKETLEQEVQESARTALLLSLIHI
eukprot:TRINITY_DN3987_c0_g1_i1.p2 TRINITY_DN3987_c0_g1~~TRINITY_DN3987_c0_g1_i1.p2  ORF type:complete len:175 (-),score=59.19 TRINITY_DN3987_c0_g1_i1:102-626(-)